MLARVFRNLTSFNRRGSQNEITSAAPTQPRVRSDPKTGPFLAPSRGTHLPRTDEEYVDVASEVNNLSRSSINADQSAAMPSQQSFSSSALNAAPPLYPRRSQATNLYHTSLATVHRKRRSSGNPKPLPPKNTLAIGGPSKATDTTQNREPGRANGRIGFAPEMLDLEAALSMSAALPPSFDAESPQLIQPPKGAFINMSVHHAKTADFRETQAQMDDTLQQLSPLHRRPKQIRGGVQVCRLLESPNFQTQCPISTRIQACIMLVRDTEKHRQQRREELEAERREQEERRRAAEQLAREEAEKKRLAEEEQRGREEAERRAQEEAGRRAQSEAEERVREETRRREEEATRAQAAAEALARRSSAYPKDVIEGLVLRRFLEDLLNSEWCRILQNNEDAGLADLRRKITMSSKGTVNRLGKTVQGLKLSAMTFRQDVQGLQNMTSPLLVEPTAQVRLIIEAGREYLSALAESNLLVLFLYYKTFEQIFVALNASSKIKKEAIWPLIFFVRSMRKQLGVPFDLMYRASLYRCSLWFIPWRISREELGRSQSISGPPEKQQGMTDQCTTLSSIARMVAGVSVLEKPDSTWTYLARLLNRFNDHTSHPGVPFIITAILETAGYHLSKWNRVLLYKLCAAIKTDCEPRLVEQAQRPGAWTGRRVAVTQLMVVVEDAIRSQGLVNQPPLGYQLKSTQETALR